MKAQGLLFGLIPIRFNGERIEIRNWWGNWLFYLIQPLWFLWCCLSLRPFTYPVWSQEDRV